MKQGHQVKNRGPSGEARGITKRSLTKELQKEPTTASKLSRRQASGVSKKLIFTLQARKKELTDVNSNVVGRNLGGLWQATIALKKGAFTKNISAVNVTAALALGRLPTRNMNHNRGLQTHRKAIL